MIGYNYNSLYSAIQRKPSLNKNLKLWSPVKWNVANQLSRISSPVRLLKCVYCLVETWMPDRAQIMCSFSLRSIGADSSKYLQQTQQISYAHLATLVILCCWWDVGNTPIQRRLSNYVVIQVTYSFCSLCNERPRTSKSNSILIQISALLDIPRRWWRHISAPYRKVFSIILIPTRSSSHSLRIKL